MHELTKKTTTSMFFPWWDKRKHWT